MRLLGDMLETFDAILRRLGASNGRKLKHSILYVVLYSIFHLFFWFFSLVRTLETPSGITKIIVLSLPAASFPDCLRIRF